MEWISDPQIWISLFTLTILEIVLGIDNLVFISILSDKLPKEESDQARRIGLSLAMLIRIGLLMSLSWLIKLTSPLFTVFNFAASGRDLILIIGGLFLMGKSTYEIHQKLEGVEGHASTKTKVTLKGIIFQILLLDIIFSLDSVITAVGIANEVGVMITAVVISVIIMVLTVNTISDFVNDHPTVKMLALSFLLLIGFSLMAEGLHQHMEKGFIYFAMGFSVFVEFLNLRLRRRSKKPVDLHEAYEKTK
jgi:predicted tellurium resistance membrane protein TerC